MKALLVLSILSLSAAASAGTCERFFEAANKQGQKTNQLVLEQQKLNKELRDLEFNNGSEEDICTKAIELRKNIVMTAINIDKGRNLWNEAYISCSKPNETIAEEQAKHFSENFQIQKNTVENLDKGLAQRCGAEPLLPILKSL